MINHVELTGQWMGKYVAAGADMPYYGRVLRHENGAAAPKDGLYCLLGIAHAEKQEPNMSYGWRYHLGLTGVAEAVIGTSVQIDYQVEFVRDGALDAARRLRLWAPSEAGLQWIERMGYYPAWDTAATYIIGDLASHEDGGVVYRYQARRPSGPGLAALPPHAHPAVWERRGTGEREFSVALIKCGNVRLVPDVWSERLEERATVDITIGLVDLLTETAPIMDSGVIEIKTDETTDTAEFDSAA